MSGDAIEVLKLFTEDLMELVFIMGGQFFREFSRDNFFPGTPPKDFAQHISYLHS
jgi:hypothetical protein